MSRESECGIRSVLIKTTMQDMKRTKLCESRHISKNEHQKNKSLHTASEEVKINTLWLEKKKCHETVQPKSEQEGKQLLSINIKD